MTNRMSHTLSYSMVSNIYVGGSGIVKRWCLFWCLSIGRTVEYYTIYT